MAKRGKPKTSFRLSDNYGTNLLREMLKEIWSLADLRQTHMLFQMSALSLQYFTFTNAVNLHFHLWNIALYVFGNYCFCAACCLVCTDGLCFLRCCSMSNNAIPPSGMANLYAPTMPVDAYSQPVMSLLPSQDALQAGQQPVLAPAPQLLM